MERTEIPAEIGIKYEKLKDYLPKPTIEFDGKKYFSRFKRNCAHW